jgi:hypothetical protein
MTSGQMTGWNIVTLHSIPGVSSQWLYTTSVSQEDFSQLSIAGGASYYGIVEYPPMRRASGLTRNPSASPA